METQNKMTLSKSAYVLNFQTQIQCRAVKEGYYYFLLLLLSMDSFGHDLVVIKSVCVVQPRERLVFCQSFKLSFNYFILCNFIHFVKDQMIIPHGCIHRQLCTLHTRMFDKCVGIVYIPAFHKT